MERVIRHTTNIHFIIEEHSYYMKLIHVYISFTLVTVHTCIIFFLILNKIKLFNLLRHASDTPLYSLTCEGFPGVSSLIQHIKLEIRTSCAHE